MPLSYDAVDKEPPPSAYYWPESKRPPLNKAFFYGPIGAGVLDGVSTLDAISRGGVEANPTMRGVSGNAAALMGVKAASGLGVALLAKKLAASGHRGWAKIIAGLGTAVPTAAAIHNFTLQPPPR